MWRTLAFNRRSAQREGERVRRGSEMGREGSCGAGWFSMVVDDLMDGNVYVNVYHSVNNDIINV